MLVAVDWERLHTHPGMLLPKVWTFSKSPALWSVVKQFCEGRDSAAGFKTPFNNLDEDPPVWGGPGLKVTKLPFFRKKGYSSSSTRDEVFSPNFYKTWDTKNILYLGNFQHRPNVDAVRNFINHCWHRIIKEVPDAKFYAVGFNPPQELLNFKSDNVIIQKGGDKENVRQIYWNSDVFAAPIELGTGFRGKLLEAKACGIPVVATSLATFGIDPVNEEEMFVADDYDNFSSYIIMLLKDIKLRKHMSKNGLALARKFDHMHAAEKLEKVLKQGVEP